jgi:hypothetical protein
MFFILLIIIVYVNTYFKEIPNSVEDTRFFPLVLSERRCVGATFSSFSSSKDTSSCASVELREGIVLCLLDGEVFVDRFGW